MSDLAAAARTRRRKATFIQGCPQARMHSECDHAILEMLIGTAMRRPVVPTRPHEPAWFVRVKWYRRESCRSVGLGCPVTN